MTQTPEPITLSKNLKVDGKNVNAITLREPSAGEMRGIKLTDLLQMDPAALIRVIPRISEPPLSETDVAGLGPRDLLKVGAEVVKMFAGEDEQSPPAQ